MSSDSVGHPRLHTTPERAPPGLANGPLMLPAAELDSGPHQGRGTNLRLSGGWGGGEGAECGNTGFADDLVGNEDTASFRISLVLLTVFTVCSPVTCISKLGVVRCIIMTLLLPFFNDKKATSFESSDINQTNFSSPLSCAVSLLVDLLVSLF